MADIVVLKGQPEYRGLAGPVILGLLSLGLFSYDAALASGALAGAGIWGYLRVGAKRDAIAAHQAFLKRAQTAVDLVNSPKDPPAIAVPFNLQKGEACYWVGRARWYELRKQTKRIGYSGFTVSVPIMKHVRYRIGTIAPTIASTEALALIDSGPLYVTNKRIFFDGQSKNVTLRFGSLAAVQLFNGGINLEKQTGRTPTLLIPEGAEQAAAFIARGQASD